jgi:hypothetical protein
MRRFVRHLLVLYSIVVAAGGCAICASPDDEAYASYGGIVERHDPYRGRVGSAFTPAVETVSHSEEVAEEWPEGEFVEPTPAEEIAPAAPIEDSPEDAPEDSPEAGDESPMSPAAPEVFYE